MTSSSQINQSILKKSVKKIFGYFGLNISRKNSFNDRWAEFIIECDNEDRTNIDNALKYALCTKPNLWSLIQSIKYISEKQIKGDFVECGVFRGGSLGLMAHYAQKYKINCKILGYDTFEDGFLKSTLNVKDVSIKNEKIELKEKIDNFYPTKLEVEQVLKKFYTSAEYSPTLIKGDILKTLKKEENIPSNISLLRMDTDLYSTTKLQLETLYPKLEKGGILHIDDYGFCPGVKDAVDEYFTNQKIWLHRVDLSCRLMIKS
tara:strand:+ start:469 stop:1251 length:783 start_codon:yes stop_codon:yes gene_type:complete